MVRSTSLYGFTNLIHLQGGEATPRSPSRRHKGSKDDPGRYDTAEDDPGTNTVTVVTFLSPVCSK